MKRCLKATVSALLCAGLSGCMGSAPPAGPRVDTMEQNAIMALRDSHETRANADLDAALTNYQSLDNLTGEWRIHYIRAKLDLAEGKVKAAKKEADALAGLAATIGTDGVEYRTNLVLGRARSDKQDFRNALRYASTPLEKAVVQTYLGNTARAMRLIDPKKDGHPADRAFVYYRRASDTQSMQLFRKSLVYYRLADDPRGVADSLVRLARISAARRQPAAAANYAARAIRVLEASGDTHRAAAVRRWLDKL